MAETAVSGGITRRPPQRTGVDSYDWVSATRLRNHMLDNPLLDWLDMHGSLHGFWKDPVDERTCYRTFLFDKGNRFEQAVVDHLHTLDVGEMLSLEGNDWTETGKVLRSAPAMVLQAPLSHEPSRTYGTADLLVRSDVLHGLFPEAVTAEQAATPCELGIGDRHYVVVDIKYSTLRLRADGAIGHGGSVWAYKGQLLVYTRALASLQGFSSPVAFLLGRGWTQTVEGETLRMGNCMDRLGAADMTDETLVRAVRDAADWVRQASSEGASWSALPPSREELRPNAGADQGPWSTAVTHIVEEGQDLTRLWQVGVAKRKNANRQGVYQWSDPRVSGELFDLRGRRAAVLNSILDANRSGGPPVRPRRIQAARSQWHPTPPLEFYVDFETVSDADDDLSGIPLRGGQPLIFMIGCGHVENDQWQYQCWITDQLTPDCEAAIIDAWFDHMDATAARLSPDVVPKVMHWSAAETSQLETAYTSAAARHPNRSWPSLNWFDLLTRVIKAEPVTIAGAWGFGLKPVTKALARLGLVDVSWGEGPGDGLGAMVGAWWCQQQVNKGLAGRLGDLPLMQQIRDYNETDCRAIWETVAYLRRCH